MLSGLVERLSCSSSYCGVRASQRTVPFGMSQAPAFVWKQAHEQLSSKDLSRQALNQDFINIGHPAGSFLTTRSAEKKKNVSRNRYANILPFDHNGVKVRSGHDDTPRGRYINASLLSADDSDKVQWQYIATQGPMASTIKDFWSMVVEQQCVVIVMLTRVKENGTDKCSQYFPEDPGDVMVDSGLRVACTAKNNAGHDSIIKRSFSVQLSSSNEPFVCSHYLMLSWPDHGAPKDSHSIRELIECVNQDSKLSKGRTCVHCSAGVGRTGTYVVIDIIIKRLHFLESATGVMIEDVASALDTKTLIEHLRTQRVAMVQSVEQLRYIYLTLLEYVASKTASFQ